MNKALIFFATVFAAFTFQLPKAIAADEITYDWLTMGKKSGSMKVIKLDDRHSITTFEFNDRGRGPNLTDEIWLNKDLTIQKQQVSGHAYMGAKVKEVFTQKGKLASWKNAMENASIELNTTSFYNAADSAPYSFELLVKAIYAAKEQKLALLPSGTATLDKILTAAISNGKEEKKVSLIAINGFGFTPSYGWFDDDNNLFGFTFGWMGMAAEGWSESLPQLQKLQDKVKDNYFVKKAETLGLKLEGAVLIKNINVFTATNQGMLENTNVIIKKGKIFHIGNKIPKIGVSKTINGKGKTLMPGLWDMHTHMSLEDGFLNIAAGVTSVRDMANKHEKVMKVTKLFASGDAIGPNVYRAGFIDKKSPFSAPTGKLAETLDEALDFVDWYADRGYQQIKIYSSIDPQWVKPLADRTHQRGMKLSGHIPSFMTTEQAVRDGFDEIQHINMLFLNFLADKDSDTRTPLRFTLVGGKAGELDLESKAVTDFIKLLKDKDIIIDSTATIFEGMFLNKAGEIDPSYAAIADNMPTDVKRGFLAGDLDINESNEKAYAKSSAAVLKLIKKLYDAGIRLVPGTDALAGFALHRELEIYAKAGIPNEEVLKIATANAARIAGQSDVGTVEVGQAADLIIVEGNPLNNISDIRKINFVFKGEYLYIPAKLYRSIGIKPFTKGD